MRTLNLAQLDFSEAAETWLETRRGFLAEVTIRDYKIYIGTLANFFGTFKLTDISADEIRRYQRYRRLSVSPGIINKETSVLQQLLKRIGVWSSIASDFQPLPASREFRGRSLTDSEYITLFRVAASDPNWESAYLFAQLSVNTGMGPKEVRTLRLKDIDLSLQLAFVHPGGAKNIHRVREVPLNGTAFLAICRSLEMAKARGSVEPNHYIFSFRIKRNEWDPTRPQVSFKKAWSKLCAAAGLERFRMYDLRHTAATYMLSDPRVPVESAIAVLGHVSPAMLKRYCHLGREAKRIAVTVLERKSQQSVQNSAQSINGKLSA